MTTNFLNRSSLISLSLVLSIPISHSTKHSLLLIISQSIFEKKRLNGKFSLTGQYKNSSGNLEDKQECRPKKRGEEEMFSKNPNLPRRWVEERKSQ